MRRFVISRLIAIYKVCRSVIEFWLKLSLKIWMCPYSENKRVRFENSGVKGLKRIFIVFFQYHRTLSQATTTSTMKSMITKDLIPDHKLQESLDMVHTR